MRFWDSSALIPLLIAEPTSVFVTHWLAIDPVIVVGRSLELKCCPRWNAGAATVLYRKLRLFRRIVDWINYAGSGT